MDLQHDIRVAAEQPRHTGRKHDAGLVRRHTADVRRTERAARIGRAADRLRKRQHVVHVSARARMDFNRLDPFVFSQVRRHFEILVRDLADRWNLELFVHREHGVRRPNRPAFSEHRRRRQVCSLAFRRTGVDPRNDRVDFILRQTGIVLERSERRIGAPQH